MSKTAKPAPRILLDTNIWLDYYDRGRSAHGDAVDLVSYAKMKGIALLYAVSNAKDLYYLINRAMKQQTRKATGTLTEHDALIVRTAAWGVVEHLSQEAFAVGADESDVWLACKYRRVHDDFEDDLLIAAAQRAQADYLVTNDERLLKHAPVAALSARDALAALRALG